ncbi:MAG: hypothetical protein AAF907_10070, partial [Planctomycetota bacterium]
VGVAAVLAGSGGWAGAQEELAPVSHLIPADAIGAMTLDATRVKADPLFQQSFGPLLQPDKPMAEPLEILGLSLENLEAMAIYLPPAPEPDPEDRYPRREPFGEPIFLFRGAEAFTPAERLLNSGVARMLPDGRTVAVSDDRDNAEAMEKLGEAAAPKPGSAAALAEALTREAPAALTMYGDVTAIRTSLLTELDRAVRDEEAWIPVFGMIRPAIVNADSYTLAIDLMDGTLSARLLAGCPSDAAAERLEKTANAGLTVLENILNGLPGAVMRRDPGEAALVTLIANAARKVTAAAEIARKPYGDGGFVTITASADGEITGLMTNMMAGLMEAEMGGGRAVEAAPAGPYDAEDYGDALEDPASEDGDR